MKVRDAAHRLICLLEALSIYALFSTDEIEKVFFLIPTAFALITFSISKLRKQDLVDRGILPDKVIFAGIVAMLITSAGYFIYSSWHPVVITGTALPILHSILWLQRFDIRNRAFRLGVSFVELVLSTHITPEFYIAFIVFIFMITASIALSCLFLERDFSSRAEQYLKRPLPKRFLTQSASLAFVVLLFSIFLYPILPRPKVNSASSWGGSGRTGYSEKVQLDGWKEFSGTGGGPIVIRAFIPDNSSINDVSFWIPKLLLKGTTLDHFNGTQWVYNSKVFRETPLKKFTDYTRIPSSSYEIHKLEILREPIGSNILPVPYGTRFVETEGYRRPIRLPQGSWVFPNSENRSVKYFTVQSFKKINPDLPRPSHLHVPREFNQEGSRWKKLATQIFKKGEPIAAHLHYLQQYFKDANFSPSTEPGKSRLLSLSGSQNPHVSGTMKTKMYLDSFMFSARSGHCELFSSAGAILLRLAGIPARVVTGFRASTDAVAGVINIRQGDAHAWIEAWDPTRGWISLDLTPSIRKPGNNWLDPLAQARDLMQAYWYKYFLRYDHEQQANLGKKAIQFFKEDLKSLRQSEKQEKDLNSLTNALLTLTSAFILGFILYVFRQKWKWGKDRRREPRYASQRTNRELMSRRSKMNRFIQSLGYQELNTLIVDSKPLSKGAPSDHVPQWYLGLIRWGAIDQRLRFGPSAPGSQEWDQHLAELDGIWENYHETWSDKLSELEYLNKVKNSA